MPGHAPPPPPGSGRGRAPARADRDPDLVRRPPARPVDLVARSVSGPHWRAAAGSDLSTVSLYAAGLHTDVPARGRAADRRTLHLLRGAGVQLAARRARPFAQPLRPRRALHAGVRARD